MPAQRRLGAGSTYDADELDAEMWRGCEWVAGHVVRVAGRRWLVVTA